MRRAGGDVIGVDWRTPLVAAWERVGPDVGVQGNLDPAVLSAPWDVIEAETDRVLVQANGRDGHVFNLGHGVPPTTDPDTFDGSWIWSTSGPNDRRHRVERRRRSASW